MAEVEFTAGFQDLKTLQGILENNIPKAARDSAAAMETAFRKQEAAVNRLIKRNESLGQTAISVTKGNQAYYNSVLGITKAKTDLTAKTSLLVRGLEEEARASKEKAVATQQEAKELERLRQSYDPLYRASQLYAKQESELQALMNSGVGSTQRYQQALDQLNKEYQDFGNGVATATNRFASNALGAQRGMNGLGMAMQQTGYQVGDFLVQVQGGTNPMVAFGQQATQLVGVLYLLPPALLNSTVGIGALRVSVTALIASLGIIIPLATALGAAWMRTSGEGQTLSQTVDDLEASLQNLTSITETYTLKGLADLEEKYGGVNAQVLQLVENQKFLAETAMSKSIADTVKSLEDLAGGRWFDIGITERASALISLQSQFKITKNDADALYESFQGVSDAEKGSLAQADALSKVASNLKIILSNTDDVTQAQLDALQAVVDTESAIREMADAAPDGNWMNAAISGVSSLYDNVVATLTEVIKLKKEAYETPVVRPQGRPDDIDFGYRPNPAGGTRPQGRPLDFGAPPTTKGRGGGSSKKGPSARSTEGIGSFVQTLIGTQEDYEAQIAQAEAWKEDAFARMKDFNKAELEILGGQANAKLLIEEEFQSRLEKLQKAERDAKLSGYQSMFSDLSSLMQTENTKLFKIGQAAAIAEATISGYRAAVEAWEWGMARGGPPVAAAATAASLVKTGVLISSIASQSPNGGGSTSAASGSSGSSAIATPTVQEQQGPQEVILRGLKPGMRLSPEELQEVFDQIYDENDRRGTIFRVDLS